MEGAFLDPGLYLQEFGHRGMQPCEAALPAAAGSPTDAASSPEKDAQQAPSAKLPAEAGNAQSTAESPARASGNGLRTGGALLICPAAGADAEALLRAWELGLVDGCPTCISLPLPAPHGATACMKGRCAHMHLPKLADGTSSGSVVWPTSKACMLRNPAMQASRHLRQMA